MYGLVSLVAGSPICERRYTALMISVVISGNGIPGFNDSKFTFSIILLPIPQLFFQSFTLLFKWIFLCRCPCPMYLHCNRESKNQCKDLHCLSILHRLCKQTGTGMRLELRWLNIPLLLPFPGQTYPTQLCLIHNLFGWDLTSKLPGYLILFLPLSHPK